MDTTGFSQVGRYGTLSLLKRRSNLGTESPNDLITSFGIDDATLTFGSTSSCGVRLYYPDVDPLHCKLIFEDGKAFLSVLGQSGVFVDGCWVYPHSSSSGSNPSTQDQEHQQTIIPLSNSSEFEIHQKRFRFTYPPKEIRKVLLATPAPVKKRALRLSMIQSAQVFSPRPSKDPRENLRILQSPLKQGIFPPNSPAGSKTPARTRAVSPLKYSAKSDSSGSDSDEEVTSAQEEEIILVETNHPRVVEEEQDLVILEDVPLGGGVHAQAQAAPEVAAPQPQPPRTPRRKSLGGTALHRAVLIRSAQRAVWRAEREKEEEEEREEEMEVLGAVVDRVEVEDDGAEDYDEEEEGDFEDNDVEMRSVSSHGEASDDEDDAEEMVQEAENKSLWRKSLTRILPWGFGTSTDNDDDDEAGDHVQGDPQDKDSRENQEEEGEEPAPLPSRPAQTPIRRVLGSFMTPQAQNAGHPQKNTFPTINPSQPPMAPPGLPEPTQAAAPRPGPGQYSLGGGEARRVTIQQPWRVKDLVIPPPAGSPALASGSNMAPPATPGRDAVAPISRATPAVTAEERRAIQERRRSAVREVREDTFWKDGAPGMSPAKTSARVSVGDAAQLYSPVKGGSDAPGPTMSAPRRHVFTSPTKGRALGYAIAEEGDSSMAGSDDIHRTEEDAEEDAVDTRSLLDRMRETVEDMKRRRSIASTPRPENLMGRPAPTPGGVPTSVALASPTRPLGGAFALGSVKKLDFSRIGSPAVRAAPTPAAAAADAVSSDAEQAKAIADEDEPFSLLRPGAHNATPSASTREPPSRDTPQVEKAEEEKGDDGDDVRLVPLPDVVIDDVQDTPEDVVQDETIQHPKETKGKARSRSKLLRAPKAAAAIDLGEEEEVGQEASRPQVTTKTTRSRSAKSPAPPPEPEEPVPVLAPPVTRRQRSKTPQAPPVEENEPPPTRSRRTRRGTTEPEEPTPAAVKRGRKATVEPEVEEEQEKTARTPAAKRGRKPRVAPVEETEHEEEEAVADAAPDPVPVATPVKRSRSRKAAAREPPAPENDADELDSYEVLPASSSTKQSSIPVKAAPKGRKKAAVKQESAEEEAVDEPLPLATTRAASGRAAKTPVPSKIAIPATAPTKTAKARGKPRTPAPVAARASGSTSAANAEKENTHGTAGSGSAVSEEVDDAPVKVRVSRRTGAAAATTLDSGKATKTAITRSAPKAATRLPAKSKVKAEEDQGDTGEVARGRTTRATRTRTKTS